MTSIAVDAARQSELGEAIHSVRQSIANAASQSKYSNSRPRLVIVSKLKPSSDLLAAYQADAQNRHFGENYVQELIDKAQELPTDIKWHFIGSLQSNKCKALAAIPNLYAVETLDSIKKADLLDKAIDNSTRDKLNVFIQVNTSGEDSKSGVEPLQESSDDTAELITIAKHIRHSCPNLHLQGLMTIGAIARSQAVSTDGNENEDFVTLRTTASILARKLGISKQELELSMGMSSDFEEAIQSGSHNVRVGSNIFGQRPSKEEAKALRETAKEKS